MTIHLSIAATVQHLLFAFLLVIAPAWDYYDTRRLKRNPTSPNKLCYYKTLCLWLWISAAVACVFAGWREIVTMAPRPGDVRWLFGNLWARYAVLVLLFVFAAVFVIGYAQVAWSKVTGKPRKYASAELLQNLTYAYLFPATRIERRWWWLVALTAGICEEVLFRGFLLQYLHTSPWQVNLTVALIIAAIIFGLQHLYQGLNGTLSTSVVGLLLGLLFVLSGSLFLPILLHAAMDLRLLTMLRPTEK